MNETIFQKLIERIEKRKFDKIKVGYADMMGFILSKSDWKRYQKAITNPGTKPEPLEIMWFRGYPLKEKND